VNRLISRLVDGINAVKEEGIAGPDGKVAEGEVVIGTICDLELRKFHEFREELHRGIQAKKEALRELKVAEGSKEHVPEKCPGCIGGAELIGESEFAEAVSNLFWSAVKDSLSISDRIKIHEAGGVGLRENWQIVTLADRGNPLAGLLALSLLGGFPPQE
jgi:hypothetical protein